MAEGLLAQPTVPLVEDLPIAHVLAFAGARPGLVASEDGAGNVVVQFHGGEADASRPLVLVAHLDHPGFSVEAVDGAHATVTFRGGLAAEHAQAGSPLDLFRRGQRDPVGRGELVDADADERRLTGGHARLLEGDVAPGDFAMWGFPGFEVVDGHIRGRVCDDLLGAAAVLAALDEVARRAPDGAEVWGLFTRAEEIGFLGALEAIRRKTVPDGASVISVECSQALSGAPQGEGVIVRVGDRRSIFDPGLTAARHAAAGRVASTDPGFRWQRKLMDGGICEASAFLACGYRASGLALPLGNYHNALDGGAGVGPEHVAVADYLAGVRLLVEMGCSPALFDGPDGPPEWLAGPMARARQKLGTREAPGA
ncbi:hypothetical protein BH20ACT1_BH20ACT1_14730 [soil metagenome]